MTVNLSPMAAFVLVLTIAPAGAASMFQDATTTAEISGHNVYSRFLPGAFIAVPDNWSSEFGMGKTPDARVPAVGMTALQPGEGSPDQSEIAASLSKNPDLHLGSPSQSPDGSDGSSGRDGGIGPIDGGSTPAIGTVPLPPALPMFGAALLALSALGFVVRRARGA